MANKLVDQSKNRTGSFSDALGKLMKFEWKRKQKTLKAKWPQSDHNPWQGSESGTILSSMWILFMVSIWNLIWPRVCS